MIFFVLGKFFVRGILADDWLGLCDVKGMLADDWLGHGDVKSGCRGGRLIVSTHDLVERVLEGGRGRSGFLDC